MKTPINSTIYTTDTFLKSFKKADSRTKSKINEIVYNLNTLIYEERENYIKGFFGASPKVSSNPDVYHCNIFGQRSLSRLYYVYAKDLKNNVVINPEIYSPDDIIFIKYDPKHVQSNLIVREYKKQSFITPKIYPLVEKTEEGNIEITLAPFRLPLDDDQRNTIQIEEVLSVRGSAGTGKTVLSFEILKNIADKNLKTLYLTYTSKLIRRAKNALELDFYENENTKLLKINDIYNLYFKDNLKVLEELEARSIINAILKEEKKLAEIFNSDYLVYSYIRGVLKGHFIEKTVDYEFDKLKLNSLIKKSIPQKHVKRVYEDLLRYLKTKPLTIDEFTKMTTRTFKRKVNFSLTQEQIDEINDLREPINKFFKNSKEEAKKELSNELSDDEINQLLTIRDKYNKRIEGKYLDDNDIALKILNHHISEEDKFDIIIVDETQDLTLLQIKAINKLLKKGSRKIYMFGDPNQTINPTVYDYGKYNSPLWEIMQDINEKTLNVSYRAGENLLNYVNQLVKLRSDFKLYQKNEDLEEEHSGRKGTSGYFACLIEKESVILSLIENLQYAEDVLVIVDNEEVKKEIIKLMELTIPDKDYIESFATQIVTVQESKGLESKNVIIYNMISDNLDIFEDIINCKVKNHRVALMTFNKFYVSVTRAQNTIIICETKLKDKNKIKDKFFKLNNGQMLDMPTEDQVSSYLEINANPEIFYNQALKLIEDHEFENAYNKKKVALLHLINQFDDDKNKGKDNDLEYLPEEVKKLNSYRLLGELPTKHNINNIIMLIEFYNDLLIELDEFEKSDIGKLLNQLEKESIETLRYRYDMLLKIIDYEDDYNKYEEYIRYKKELSGNNLVMSDDEILLKHEQFIDKKTSFVFAYKILDDLDANKEDYIKIIKAIEDEKSLDDIRLIDTLNYPEKTRKKIFRKILDIEMHNEFFKIENIIFDMEEMK